MPRRSAMPSGLRRAGWRSPVAHRAALTAAILAVGCGHEQSPAPPPPEVAIAEVVQQDVPVFHGWVGTIDGFVNAEIRPKVQGYLLSQDYQNGTLVKAGELLFQIDPRQFESALLDAQGQLAAAKANLGRSSLNVARYKPLVKEGAVSQEEYDNTYQQMLADQASVQQGEAAVAQANLNLGWTQVTSPIAGIAGINVAQIGDLVGPQTVLTTVSQVDPIKVEFPISEQEYLGVANKINQRLTTGKPAPDAPALHVILATGEEYPHAGTIYAVNRQVDVGTGTIILQGTFPNPDNVLRPGQFARVRAEVQRQPNALVIPQRAVQDLQGIFQVAVVGPDDVVEFRSVEVGEKSGTDWVITKGLEAGDRVIIDGLQKVSDGLKVVAHPASSAAASPAAGAGATAAAHGGGE